MKQKLPKYFNTTLHKFRVEKRQALTKAVVALDKALSGAAYAPSITYNGQTVSLLTLLQLARQLREAWSQKNWGK